MTTPKKTRTPRNFESILSGAIKLTIKEMADLKTAIETEIKARVAKLEQDAKAAREDASI